MDWHPIQGGVEILLVASRYRNRDKLRPNGPLGSYADFTFTYSSIIGFERAKLPAFFNIGSKRLNYPKNPYRP